VRLTNPVHHLGVQPPARWASELAAALDENSIVWMCRGYPLVWQDKALRPGEAAATAVPEVQCVGSRPGAATTGSRERDHHRGRGQSKKDAGPTELLTCFGAISAASNGSSRFGAAVVPGGSQAGRSHVKGHRQNASGCHLQPRNSWGTLAWRAGQCPSLCLLLQICTGRARQAARWAFKCGIGFLRNASSKGEEVSTPEPCRRRHAGVRKPTAQSRDRR